MSDQSTENLIQKKGLNAPRVTPADLEAAIRSEFYFTAHDGVMGASQLGTSPAMHTNLDMLTFCVLVLDNGFSVVGKSACVSRANFNAEIGKKIARENAVNELWPLLGFRLADAVRVQRDTATG